MKKITAFILSLLLILSFASCSKTEEDTSVLYERINTLAGSYSADTVSYTIVLTSEKMGITLNDKGTVQNDNGTYTYTYSYQYLNEIGSGAESLIKTEEGTVTGTKDEILSEGFSVTDGTKVVALNLKDSFKTHTVTVNEDSYVMTGYIARNTILENTDHIDNDIRFYYELTVDKNISKIEKLVITYLTSRFDSVVITVTFGEGA